MDFIGMVISILFISSPLLIWAIKHYSGRLYVKDYDNVHPDAMIVNVSHEKTGWRSSTEIKTIVTFADGVEYHTYRSKSEPGLGYTKLIVDDEVKEIITKKAIIAHKKLAVRLSKNSPQETFTKVSKEKEATSKIGKCDICGKENTSVFKCTIKDEYGTRYRNLCEECSEKSDIIL